MLSFMPKVVNYVAAGIYALYYCTVYNDIGLEIEFIYEMNNHSSFESN